MLIFLALAPVCDNEQGYCNEEEAVGGLEKVCQVIKAEKVPAQD